eukprot:GEMP01002283.1.p1 GENE.GEMP01002283.1~~GEMP01002283.1.p1  ORF type:complete len:954 (+),score=273.54 GEMP01002283.1:235-2862(+)
MEQKKLEREKKDREKQDKHEREQQDKFEREEKEKLDREKRGKLEREKKEKLEQEKKEKNEREQNERKQNEKDKIEREKKEKEKAKFERKEKSEREKKEKLEEVELEKQEKMVWGKNWEREKSEKKKDNFEQTNKEQFEREKLVKPKLKLIADEALKGHDIIPSAQMKRKSSRKRAFNSIIMNDAAAEEGEKNDVVPAPLLKKRKSARGEDDKELRLTARRSLSIMTPMLRRRKKTDSEKPVFIVESTSGGPPVSVFGRGGKRVQQKGKGLSGKRSALRCVREVEEEDEGVEEREGVRSTTEEDDGDKNDGQEEKTDDSDDDARTSSMRVSLPEDGGECEQKLEKEDKEEKPDFYPASRPRSRKLDDADSTLSLQLSCDAEDSPSRGSSPPNARMISSPSRSVFSQAASPSRGPEDGDEAKSGDASTSSDDDDKSSNDNNRMPRSALSTPSMVRHVQLIAQRRMKRSYSAMHGDNHVYSVKVNGKGIGNEEDEGIEMPPPQSRPKRYEGAEDDPFLSRARGRPKKRHSLAGLFAPSSPLGRLVGRSPPSNDAMMRASPGHHAAASSSTYNPAMEEATVLIPEPERAPVATPSITPAPPSKRKARGIFAIGEPYSRFEGPVTRSRAKKKNEELLAAALTQQQQPDDAASRSSSSSSPRREATVDEGQVPERIRRSHVRVNEDVEKTQRSLNATEQLVVEKKLAGFPQKDDVLAVGSIPRRGKNLKQSGRKKRRTEHFNFAVMDVDDRTCRMMSQGAHLAQCSRLMGTCVVSLEPAFVDTKIVGYRLVFCHGALQFFVRVGPLAKVLQLTALQFRGGLRHDALRGRGQKVRELLQQAERRFHVAPAILNLQDIPPFSFLRSIMFLHMVVRSCEQGLFV